MIAAEHRLRLADEAKARRKLKKRLNQPRHYYWFKKESRWKSYPALTDKQKKLKQTQVINQVKSEIRDEIQRLPDNLKTVWIDRCVNEEIEREKEEQLRQEAVAAAAAETAAKEQERLQRERDAEEQAQLAQEQAEAEAAAVTASESAKSKSKKNSKKTEKNVKKKGAKHKEETTETVVESGNGDGDNEDEDDNNNDSEDDDRVQVRNLPIKFYNAKVNPYRVSKRLTEYYQKKREDYLEILEDYRELSKLIGKESKIECDIYYRTVCSERTDNMFAIRKVKEVFGLSLLLLMETSPDPGNANDNDGNDGDNGDEKNTSEGKGKSKKGKKSGKKKGEEEGDKDKKKGGKKKGKGKKGSKNEEEEEQEKEEVEEENQQQQQQQPDPPSEEEIELEKYFKYMNQDKIMELEQQCMKFIQQRKSDYYDKYILGIKKVMKRRKQVTDRETERLFDRLFRNGLETKQVIFEKTLKPIQSKEQRDNQRMLQSAEHDIAKFTEEDTDMVEDDIQPFFNQQREKLARYHQLILERGAELPKLDDDSNYKDNQNTAEMMAEKDEEEGKEKGEPKKDAEDKQHS